MAEANMDDIDAFTTRSKRYWPLLVLVVIAAAVAIGLGVHWAVVLSFSAVALTAAFVREPRPGPVTRTNSAEMTEPDQENDLVAALSAIDMPLYLLDARENLRYENAAASSAFGLTPVGQHLSLRVRSPAILDMVRETIATGRPNSVEYSERLPSTQVYLARVAAVDPSRQKDGSERFFILSFRDISESRRIDKMRSDFVANASHELRTPLAALGGFIETLQGPARRDPKAAERFLGIMMEQVARMNRLVDDLLSLSRLELKAHIAPSERVELGPLLGYVCDGLAPLAESLGVKIEVSLPDSPVTVAGDKDELLQVFENLIQNACKYGQEGKKVEVTLGGGGDHPVEVSVRDYGQGIPAEHIPRLTERFYRVNVEASRSKKGTGLGLAIVKHILTRHRARLLVNSKVGEGSTFTVRF